MTFSMPYLRMELIRQLHNPFTLAFTLALPALMYIIFGASQDYGTMSAGHGNVAFSVMVSMAAYGVMTAMTSLTSLAASEASQGWGRQLSLTPLGTSGYAVSKVIVAFAYAALSLLVVFVIGAATGAQADGAWRWLLTAGIIMVAGTIFGLYGLGVGLMFNSDSAAGLASILLTFFAFFGNVFMPLSGTMLAIAHFTPMYGVVELARWPLSEGYVDDTVTDPMWMPILNVIAWTLVFGALVALGVKRSRNRV